jgi:hypothetical protein
MHRYAISFGALLSTVSQAASQAVATDPSEKLYCFLSIAVVAIAATIMFVVHRLARSTVGFFQGWQGVFAAWRDAMNREEKMLVVLLIFAQVLRTGAWGAVVAIITSLGGAAASVCGADFAAIIREIRLLIDDAYKLLHGG